MPLALVLLVAAIACAAPKETVPDASPDSESQRVALGGDTARALLDSAESVSPTNVAAEPADRTPERLDTWSRVALPLNVAKPTSLNLTLDRVPRWLVYSDSLAVTFDRDLSQIVILNLRSGTHRRVGRSGRGPLEFSQSSSARYWSADSVLVVDDAQRRATVASLASGEGRTFPYPSIDSMTNPNLIGALGRGELVFSGYRGLNQEGEPGQFTAPGNLVVVAGPLGSRLGSAPIRSGAFIRAQIGEGRMLAMSPMGLSPQFSVGERHAAWLAGGTDSLYLWTGGSTAPVARRLHIPFIEFDKRVRGKIEEAYLKRFTRSDPRVLEALKPLMKIPSRRPSATELWNTVDDTFWLLLQIGVTDVEGTVWIEIDSTATVKRCFTSTPAYRVVGLGHAVAVIAKVDEETEEYSISRVPLPTAPCGFTGSLVRKQ